MKPLGDETAHQPDEQSAVDGERLRQLGVRQRRQGPDRTRARREDDRVERTREGTGPRPVGAVHLGHRVAGGLRRGLHRAADSAGRACDEKTHAQELMISAMKTTSSVPFSLLSPWPEPSGVQVTSPALIVRLTPLSS